MLRLFLVFASFAIWLGSAVAAPSTDLVFCSKMPDKTERIACYDAAARIAETKPKPQSNAPAPLHPVTVAVPQPQAYARVAPVEGPLPRFHGAYVAGGGSYGMGQDIPAGFDRLRIQGTSGIGAAGYNLQSGAFVFGLELAGRYGRERGTRTETIFETTDAGHTYGSIGSVRIYSDASAHLSARAGMAVQDTLIFGQIGLGSSQIHQSVTITNFGTRCTSFGFVNDLFACTGTVPYTGSTTTSRTNWYPSALLGVGIEQNFGSRVFARISGQMEAIKGIEDFRWITRATGMMGLRL